MVAHTISIINMKGGVGKTTLAVALAEGLAVMARKRVLVVDLDAQASCTVALAGRDGFRRIIAARRHAYRLFDGLSHRLQREPGLAGAEPYYDFGDPTSAPPQRPGPRERPTRDLPLKGASLLEPTPPLDLIGSAPELQLLEREILYRLGRMTHDQREAEAVAADYFADRMRALGDAYDYIILDCPPGLSLFAESALRASQTVLAPVTPDFLSLLGLEAFARRALRKLRDREGVNLQAFAVLNRVQDTDVHAQYRALIRHQVESFADAMALFPQEIEQSNDLAAAMEDDSRTAIRKKYGSAIPLVETFVGHVTALTQAPIAATPDTAPKAAHG